MEVASRQSAMFVGIPAECPSSVCTFTHSIKYFPIHKQGFSVGVQVRVASAEQLQMTSYLHSDIIDVDPYKPEVSQDLSAS